jgi:hypothetical protein
MFIRLGVEKPGQQMATNIYAVAEEGSKVVYGVGDNRQAEKLECVRDRARTIFRTEMLNLLKKKKSKGHR